jgi:hypothetical protein
MVKVNKGNVKIKKNKVMVMVKSGSKENEVFGQVNVKSQSQELL